MTYGICMQICVPPFGYFDALLGNKGHLCDINITIG